MAVAILLLVAGFRMPGYIASAMAVPLFKHQGFTNTDIATVTKVFGFWIALRGTFMAGWLIPRIGMMSSLIIGTVAGSASRSRFLPRMAEMAATRRRRAHQPARSHRLEIHVRHQRRQGEGREVVQTRDLGQHPSGPQEGVETGRKGDIGGVRRHVARAGR
ncbi:hypothetical protein ACVWVY_007994 [Bradyrhizobium sp. URHC0002]